MQPAPRSIRPTKARASRPEQIQLCLIGNQVPPPTQDVLGTLPETDVGEAITILAQMIAQTARPQISGAGDE